tara:strand:- start:2461 stop:2763 length:303 start_codon:yes stop_codon:yes gene_type:complete
MIIPIFVHHKNREKAYKDILIDSIHHNRFIPISKNPFIIYKFFLQDLDSIMIDDKKSENNSLIHFIFKGIWFKKQKKIKGNLLIDFYHKFLTQKNWGLGN